MRNNSISVIALMVAVLALAATLPAQRSGGTGTTTTTSGRAGAPIAGAPPSTGAARGARPSQPTNTSPAAIAVKSATERVTKLNKAIVNLDKAATRAMPKSLTAAEQEQWAEQGKWIRSVKSRYAGYTQELDTATKSRRDAMDVITALSELDEKYIELQVATQEESQKFTGLSKPLQSRHDAAMKAIKDIK